VTQTPVEHWICYDFKNRSVQLTHYSIRSAKYGYPRSWVLEWSSNYTGPWTQLDSQSGDPRLNGIHRVATFPTTGRGAFHCIRLLQTGAPHGNQNWLTLAALELFGHASD
jgi:hypothetical protein